MEFESFAKPLGILQSLGGLIKPKALRCFTKSLGILCMHIYSHILNYCYRYGDALESA